jgi:hypothetical protein
MLAQVLTLLFLRRLELHNSAAEAAVVAAAESSEVFDLHATAAERRPAPSAEALPVTEVEGGGGVGVAVERVQPPEAGDAPAVTPGAGQRQVVRRSAGGAAARA